MPKLVMMFMTLQPTAASAFWAGRVRARRLRPITCMQRIIATALERSGMITSAEGLWTTTAR